MKTYNDRMADVTARIRSKKRRRKALAISCLSLALVLVASWMLIPSGGKPGSNLEGTETTGGVLEHDYAQVAEKLNVLLRPNNGSSSGDHNTGSSAAVSGTTAGVMAPGTAPDDDYVYEGNPGGGASGGSVEVTDNQVQGVTEADLFKRTTEHIFYLRSGQISAYSIAGEDSALVGVYNIDLVSDEEYFGKLAFATRWEMYLSEDGNTLTVLAYVCYEESGAMVVAVGLDVSDVTNIQQINRVFLTGYYLSSRMVDDQLLLMTRYNISRNMNPEDPSTYVPSVGTPGNMQLVAAENIFLPENVTEARYTVVCSLDSKTLEMNDSLACLSFSNEVYVSQDHIYVARAYSKKLESSVSSTMSEIVCIRYGDDQLELVGAVEVEGSIKNQYSMDEYNGILRVVTSINRFQSGVRIVNASLYCISLETMEVISSVECFAPDWENVQSVRFDGDKAYVCTAEIVTWTDPVFFFDLSDPYNITWTDTGVIEGYSSSLIQLGDGYLLGVGYGQGGNLKLEVYAEEGESVISVAVLEPEFVSFFSEEYKSYYIDREADLIGLGVEYWTQEGGSKTEYILVYFDGYSLQIIATAECEGNLHNVRATMIDDYLYVLSSTFDVVYVG